MVASKQSASILLCILIQSHLIHSIDESCNDSHCAPFTVAEKQAILDLHNELRDRVASGALASEGQPAAKDMNSLMWDDGLAKVAQNYAETCPGLVHNPNKNVQAYHQRQHGNTKWGNIDGPSYTKSGDNFIFVGENVAVTSGTYDMNLIINQMEKGWFDEYEVYTWDDDKVGDCDVNADPDHRMCGHYTAMVWANTRYVGCGYANGCSINGWKSIFVCNYFPAGNFNTGSTPPYIAAYEDDDVCSDCMSDRPQCKSPYDSRSITASEYNDGRRFNALCDGGACATMCDGQSWDRRGCDGGDQCVMDCMDGTDGNDGGRDICGPPTTYSPTPAPIPTPAPTLPPKCIIIEDSWWGDRWNGQWDYFGLDDQDMFVWKHSTYYLDYTPEINGYAFKATVDSTAVYGYCKEFNIMDCTAGNWWKYDWTQRKFVVEEFTHVTECADHDQPTPQPTARPTIKPTSEPTKKPTSEPTKAPVSSGKSVESAPAPPPPILRSAPAPAPEKKARPTKAPRIKPSKAPKIKPSKEPKSRSSGRSTSGGTTKSKRGGGRGGGEEGDNENENEEEFVFFDVSHISVHNKRDILYNINVYSAMLIFSLIFFVILSIYECGCGYHQIEKSKLHQNAQSETKPLLIDVAIN